MVKTKKSSIKTEKKVKKVIPEKDKKITCSARELKKTERRGSMLDCAKKKQIRYYGVKKADSITIGLMFKKKEKAPKITLNEAVASMRGIKFRADKIKARIETAKLTHNKEKLEKNQAELEKLREKYAKVVKIVNKLRLQKK
jgi:hypothetical protein